MKSKKLGRTLLRAVLISTLVCTINMNIIINKGTFSMFTSSAQGTATIKTADAGNLIREFNVVEEFGQQFIVIEPGEFLADNSIVYFEVTGEASSYIAQLNPVTLSKDKTPMNSNSMKWDSMSRILRVSKNKQYFISNDGKFYIPIFVNVSLRQKLTLSSKDKFDGNIKLRYLNGFINENKPVALSSKYINSRWLSGTDSYFWEDVKNTLSITNTSSLSGGGSPIMASEASLKDLTGNTTTVNEFQVDFNKNFQNEFKKLFNKTLDKEQIEVIDSIADGYRKYVSDLEIKNKELLKQLEKLQLENEKLINQIDDLMKKNAGSSKELQSQIDPLKSENKQLEATIDELREIINSNTKATINPPKENGTGNEVTVPAVINGEENKAISSAVMSGDGNKGTDVAVISGTENQVIDPVVTNDTGNEKK